MASSSGDLMVNVRADVFLNALRNRKLNLFYAPDVDLKLGDIVVLENASTDQLRMEVVGIKETRYAFLEDSDLEPGVRELQSRRNVLAYMRRALDSEVEPMDRVKVIKLRAWDYDLQSLHRLVQRSWNAREKDDDDVDTTRESS